MPLPALQPCEQCGTTFAAVREHAKFCSAACRLRAYRARQADEAATKDALLAHLRAAVIHDDAALLRLVTGSGAVTVPEALRRALAP